MLEMYLKLRRVKAFLDEIAEEFVDAKSVRMIKPQAPDTKKFTVVVEYEGHEFNRLSKIDVGSL